jgi:hypothetical protein
VSRGWASRALAMLLAGTDDSITAALQALPSARRVRLARLVCAALEDAIIQHARLDPDLPAAAMADEIAGGA